MQAGLRRAATGFLGGLFQTPLYRLGRLFPTRLYRGFSVTPDLSLNPSHHGEVLKAPLAGEAPVPFQPVDVVAHGVPSDFGTAMTAVAGVVVRAGIGPGVREEALDFGARNWPVVLETEQIVRPLVADCLGNFGLTPHGGGMAPKAGQGP